MPIKALVLVIISGAVHAFWNMLLKKSYNKVAFTWLAIFSSLIFYLPIFIGSIHRGSLNGFQWRWTILSGLLQGFYFFFLSNAYRYEDMSVVYPLSRGSAPLFATLLATIFLQEHVSFMGGLGIALIIIGVWMLPNLASINLIKGKKAKGSKLAILTALAIASYHLIDKRALATNQPFAHLYLLSGLMFICYTFLTFLMLIQSPKTLQNFLNDLTSEWGKQKRDIVAVGVLYFSSYLLVLSAMSISKVSYIVAARNLSLIFGSLLGWKVLKESYKINRFLGALIITAGMVIIALS